MKKEFRPICRQHRIPKEWSLATFEYYDQSILIRIPHVYAWVCPVCQDQSFTPETTDELIETVKELVEIAKHARQRRSVLTEYVVSVGCVGETTTDERMKRISPSYPLIS